MSKMKNSVLICLLGFLSFSVKAQRFYVEETDGGYEQPILDKLISSNCKITFKRDSADYVVMCVISKSGMGRAKGSVVIIDNKSGNLLAKSQEVNGQTMMFNGYGNPRMLCMKKIADKYLLMLIAQILLQGKVN